MTASATRDHVLDDSWGPMRIQNQKATIAPLKYCPAPNGDDSPVDTTAVSEGYRCDELGRGGKDEVSTDRTRGTVQIRTRIGVMSEPRPPVKPTMRPEQAATNKE